jgi:hypothetical protein
MIFTVFSPKIFQAIFENNIDPMPLKQETGICMVARRPICT